MSSRNRPRVDLRPLQWVLLGACGSWLIVLTASAILGAL